MNLDTPPLVLIVDDDADLRALLTRWLELSGFAVRAFADAETFFGALETTVPDVVCMDVNLPGLNGLEALAQIQSRHPDVPVLMLTGDTSVQTVVSAMQAGAHDYLTKPLEKTKLISALTNAVQLTRARSEVQRLKREIEGTGYSGVIGRSSAMRDVFRQIERVAGRDISVLIHGESGTGKELVARAIHDNSRRARGPFVAVNCAAIPESLQDSELFGHERGAFTGANQQRAGHFERADGGTLFLDEIAELSLGTQAKLLRVLQERSFERVGGGRTIRSDFRLVAATHRDLRKMVQEGRFREDLMFRVAVFELELPALRERAGDVDVLVSQLLPKVAGSTGSGLVEISEAAMQCLRAHAWPGNVRELENVLSRAVVLARDGLIELDDLPVSVRRRTPAATGGEAPPAPQPSGGTDNLEVVKLTSEPQINDIKDLPLNLDELERWAIQTALARTDGQLTQAAKLLGIGRTTLYRKLAK